MKYRVDIDLANTTKAGFGKLLDGRDERLLNRIGAFASLFLPDLSRYAEPVLVMKTEEPGSKQTLAFEHNRIESVCYDMINHLINDCVVMGAEPLAVQDLIVCGRMDREVSTRIVSACEEACRAQGCVLTGGELSEQPDVVPAGTYVLGSSIVGVVERSKVIDGTAIRQGDAVIALASSGPHTNGYTMIRDLLRENPALAKEQVGSQPFIDAVLIPHRCYYLALRGLFDGAGVSGLAHITGGGIRENLNRILPDHLNASIDLRKYDVPEVFRVIATASGAAQDEMLRTFNLGVGLALVCRSDSVEHVLSHLIRCGENAYLIGEIVEGNGQVECIGVIA